MEGTLGAGSSPLTSLLASAARACEERLARYLADAPTPPDAGFRNTITFALALMRVSAEHPAPADVDLRLIRDAARDAAEACRRRGLDDDLLTAAATFDRVVHLCDRGLAQPG